ncbi:MAG: RnfABCDGE type electron transport complex subunit C, partial [Fibrobacteres bacterium]|nr:RnfABCDGE type electron transport complex subunit C [Fibrobacterota bacterium]
LMVERTEALIDGIKTLKKVLNVHKVLIGIEDNKEETIDIVRHAADIDNDIKVCVTKTRYPQGGERQLIEALTGRVVPAKPGLPMDIGVVVHNVSTCVAIYDAVYHGKPLYERILTVAGGAVANPKNLIVRNGTQIKHLAEICGIRATPSKIIMGGPMMGIAVSDMDTPVSKSTSGVLFLSEKEAKRFTQSPCIKCGSCVQACPIFLNPTLLGMASRLNNKELFTYGHGKDCMECGSCAYSCPSRIPLVHHIRLGKVKFNG